MILKPAHRRHNILTSLTSGVPVNNRPTKAQQRELNKKIANSGNLTQKDFDSLYL